MELEYKQLTESQAKFIPKLMEWLINYSIKSELLGPVKEFNIENLQEMDIKVFVSMLHKIEYYKEYTLDEGDTLTLLTNQYNNERLHIHTTKER
jgi:hypothetical protein